MISNQLPTKSLHSGQPKLKLVCLRPVAASEQFLTDQPFYLPEWDSHDVSTPSSKDGERLTPTTTSVLSDVGGSIPRSRVFPLPNRRPNTILLIAWRATYSPLVATPNTCGRHPPLSEDPTKAGYRFRVGANLLEMNCDS